MTLQTATSVGQKIALAFLGLILSLLLLEAGLRLGGILLTSMQTYENFRSIKQKGAYRILCLGESTTRRQYPHLLEKILNQRNIGVPFSVIDKGNAGINTLFILGRVESYLAEYHPDMVVAMMGINDQGVKYYQDISEFRTWIFQHSRVYRFGRILYMHLLKKLRKKDIYGSGSEVRGRKLEPDDEGTVIAKATLPSEEFVDGMAKSDPRNDKESFGVRGFSQHGDNLFQPSRRLEKATRYLRLAKLYRLQGEFFQAEDSFKKAIELDPKNAQAYAGLGLVFRAQDKCAQAEDSFKKAIELNPEIDRFYAQLGFLYMDQCQIFRGDDSFKRAMELDPQNAQAYAGLGLVFPAQDKCAQAEDSFKKAIELNPKNAQAYAGLGQVFQLQDKCAQAEDSLKKAIELNPKYDDACFELGALYRQQGKFSQADDSFRRAFEINPKHERLLGEMSLLYEEMGKPKLAKEYSEKARLLLKSGDSAVTVSSYRKLKNILDARGIRLVCVQYPMRSVEQLKRIFKKNENAIFVDNEQVFEEAVKKAGHKEYFKDMFGGDFGHCTPKGNELLAQNIADVILREVFNK